MCEAIADFHAGVSSNNAQLLLDSVSTMDLAAHAKYCYHARQTTRAPLLWLRAQDGTCYRGSALYVRSSVMFSIQDWPGELVQTVQFLDDAYMSTWEGDQAAMPWWLEWLAESQDVQVYPRLVSPEPSGAFQLSAYFKVLLTAAHSSRVLELLKTQWSRYAPWIEESGSSPGTAVWKSSRDQLVADMGEWLVSCTDGTSSPLKGTLLPVRSLSAGLLDHRRLLEVPHPDDPGWGFLRHFGVTATFDANKLLAQLRELSTIRADCPLDRASQVYFELMACDRRQWGLVR